ncbi:hypothetical protein [Kocuria rosea]|uniref:hypothetical protein n=1 Tax=Kocuria rosea TaxID=1275 RepID=UPI0011A0C16E|nr:hypothetical protein [Kocuria rosea]
MNVPEWHDLTALAVALVALIIAGIAAANQLASHKRPLPSIEVMHSDHLAKAWIPEENTREYVVARAMLLIIANRGHQTLFHPTVYDWTPSTVAFDEHEVSFSLPSKLEPGEVVEVVISHSLANQNIRTFGIVWEEASLFGRNPVQMGFRLRCKASGMWTGEREEHWKRVGPFRRKGWQRAGSIWSLWRPTLSSARTPSEGSMRAFTYKQLSYETVKKHKLLVASGGAEMAPEELARAQELGEALPG